jgi:transcriptional regulator with XRE-family HTH domain
MTAAELIRDARRRHRLSQSELAWRAGTSQATVSRIERGRLSPTIRLLSRLMAAVGETADLVPRRRRDDHDLVHLLETRRLSPAERIERALPAAMLAHHLRGRAG